MVTFTMPQLIWQSIPGGGTSVSEGILAPLYLCTVVDCCRVVAYTLSQHVVLTQAEISPLLLSVVTGNNARIYSHQDDAIKGINELLCQGQHVVVQCLSLFKIMTHTLTIMTHKCNFEDCHFATYVLSTQLTQWHIYRCKQSPLFTCGDGISGLWYLYQESHHSSNAC